MRETDKVEGGSRKEEHVLSWDLSPYKEREHNEENHVLYSTVGCRLSSKHNIIIIMFSRMVVDVVVNLYTTCTYG